MATTPGQRFVRRHDAARSSTSNTTAADIAYDTAVLSEGGYSYSSPEVTVDEAGLYLTVFDIGQVDLASTRAVGTLVPSVNTTDQTRFRATHRYLRNSGGDEGASIGMAILDLAASDDVKVRNPGVLTPTDSLGNYATRVNFGGGFQLIRLPANDFTHVERTSDAAECGISNINATRPWLDSSGTWTKITYNSEVNDDAALYSGSGGDLTLAANTKYMIVWGFTPYSTDASRHGYVGRLSIDGNNVQSVSSYQRNTASQGPPVCGMYLHETGGTAETAFLEATQEIEGGDAGTPQISDAYLQVIELPSSAEWIHADNGATDSLTTALAGTGTYYDTPLSSSLRADGNSDLSLDSANDAIQNDSGASLPVLAIGWHRWDRDSGASGVRKMPWSAWDNGGTRLGYGIAGAFSRGQQSTDDTFQAHYCSVATMDLANGADLSFQANEPASGSNSDMGVYASTSRYFLGVQVLNLDTLVAAGGEDALLADDVESTSNVGSPNIGQEHGLLADDVSATSEVSSPVIGQEHTLLATDAESSSEVSAPTLSESHILDAADVESTSEVSIPVIGQTHGLLADDSESSSEVSAPSIGQDHGLLANDVESTSEVSLPALTHLVGADNLLADDVESSSETSSPVLGQGHALTAVSVNSASEITTPSLAQVHVLTVVGSESTSEVSAPVIGQVHDLLADDTESASEVSAPAVDGGIEVLQAENVEAQSEVSTPTLRLVDDFSYYSAGDNDNQEDLILSLAREFLRKVA